MYTWDDDGSSWYGTGRYAYSPATAAKRAKESERASASGPRTYAARSGPNETLVDPRRTVSTDSTNPIVIAVDVTGSMANWPFEIFDRLPLLFNLRRDPFEKAKIGSNTYEDWYIDRAYLFGPMQVVASKFLMTLKEFPEGNNEQINTLLGTQSAYKCKEWAIQIGRDLSEYLQVCRSMHFRELFQQTVLADLFPVQGIGRIAWIEPGVRPSMSLASSPTARTCFLPSFTW